VAAKEGCVGAKYKLARSYQDGTGTPQDKVSAYLWMSAAAASSYGDAPKCLDELTKQMTPDQIAEAKRIIQEGKSAKSEESPDN